MANVIPMGDRILVERVATEERSPGGIVIPDSAREKPVEGIVIAVGPKALGCVAGDRVLFGKYSGTEVRIDNADRLVLREEDVIGIVR